MLHEVYQSVLFAPIGADNSARLLEARDVVNYRESRDGCAVHETSSSVDTAWGAKYVFAMSTDTG